MSARRADPGALETQAPRLNGLLTNAPLPSAAFAVAEIACRRAWVRMRDGVRLATDLYLPPTPSAPTVAIRTPYGRAADKTVAICMSIARRGYAVVTQDCRGTGESEPATWDYYVYEGEDSVDLVAWITAQPWFDGFIGGCGGSYVGQTQWCMATHSAMTAIAPEVSGLGVAVNTAGLHMFINAYAKAVGKGAGKLNLSHAELEHRMLDETLGGGLYNEPLYPPLPQRLIDAHPQLAGAAPREVRRYLWALYCGLTCAERAAFIRRAMDVECVSIAEVEALPRLFGRHISHDAHTLPHVDHGVMAASIRAAPLMITGWYDWGLNDALATWRLLQDDARPEVAERARLIISPGSHAGPGYHEGDTGQPELQRSHRTENNLPLLLDWYDRVRRQNLQDWPRVVYYLMGANAWRASDAWPPEGSTVTPFFLGPGGALTRSAPCDEGGRDTYLYDPTQPTPTVGGSILSNVYRPGSVDVAAVQARDDVLTYTTEVLQDDLDVAGDLKMILWASSSAVDTDFVVRLSDVFPDGRAVQLQSGILRARYRNADPEWLQPGEAYRLEIDLWATANRFRTGHRLRIDVSSADFPRFDRNTNRGETPGPPILAQQTIYRSAARASHLLLPVLGSGEGAWRRAG